MSPDAGQFLENSLITHFIVWRTTNHGLMIEAFWPPSDPQIAKDCAPPGIRITDCGLRITLSCSPILFIAQLPTFH